MEKAILSLHPSVLVIESERTREVLMGVYDESYHLVCYRGSANLIGGNPSPKDCCPKDVLLREIKEEFDYSGEGSASRKDLARIREVALSKISPFKDFYFQFGKIKGGKKPFNAISSSYHTRMDQETFEIVRNNLNGGKRITTEGSARIFTLKELVERGEFSTAWFSAPVLNSFFGIRIPIPTEVTFEELGTPRQSFGAYNDGFSYDPGWKKV